MRFIATFALLLSGISLSSRARAADAPAAKAPTGSKVTLKLQLKSGTKQNLVMTADQKIGIDLGGAAQEMTNLTSFGWTQEVQSVDPQGNATVKLTYTSVKFKMAAGPMNMEYDSEKGEPPAAVAFLGALIGQGFTFKISPAGKVVESSGSDQLLEKMAAKMDPAQKDQMMAQLKGQFGSKMVEDMYDYYPDKAVDNGESWTHTQKLPAPMAADVQIKFTLLDHVAGKSTVGVAGTIQTQDADAAAGKLSGTQAGTIVLDESTGLPVKAEMKQDLKGTVQGMPMTINSTITIESK
jgi:hypothetical protein